MLRDLGLGIWSIGLRAQTFDTYMLLRITGTFGPKP